MSQYRECVSVVFRCPTSLSRWEFSDTVAAPCWLGLQQRSRNLIKLFFFLLKMLFLVNSVRSLTLCKDLRRDQGCAFLFQTWEQLKFQQDGTAAKFRRRH